VFDFRFQSLFSVHYTYSIGWIFVTSSSYQLKQHSLWRTSFDWVVLISFACFHFWITLFIATSQVDQQITLSFRPGPSETLGLLCMFLFKVTLLYSTVTMARQLAQIHDLLMERKCWKFRKPPVGEKYSTFSHCSSLSS
jgi:hypothetical protein